VISACAQRSGKAIYPKVRKTRDRNGLNITHAGTRYCSIQRLEPVRTLLQTDIGGTEIIAKRWLDTGAAGDCEHGTKGASSQHIDELGGYHHLQFFCALA
jgi:hypothetical protein